jgi:acetyl-CoA carboxylase biotin carboxylase subunit
MFEKILIANRGEIAVRIERACRELGIKSVAIYSDADKDSMHVLLADESICIGPASASESYLSIPRIISACEIAGVDAVHPGYGFLAENPEFAEICEDGGLKFIGPTPDAIRMMGNKTVAKNTVKKVGVPVVPGNTRTARDVDDAFSLAKEIGYPVMLKAAMGGGGRGMQIVKSKDELERAFLMAKGEVKSAFGDERIYIEKYLEKPRHIEVQILGDEGGNIVWLGERECSIQRRHQKLIEESPSSAVNQEMRTKLGEMAIKAATSINYISAGTVEFLLDRDGNFYFLEMNTRVQVEHPVTEAVTGVDIVKEQIKIASGEGLGITQKDIELNGHAIECRINAEDPDRGFSASPGKITTLYVPGGPGIRIDTHIYQGYIISPNYDSLIAKVIAYGKTREEAIQRMERCLEEFWIEGIKTTIPFHLGVIRDMRFRRGEIDTGFVEREIIK